MPGKNLTQVEAQARAAMLTVDSYDIALDLTTSQETFASVTTVVFSCSQPGSDSFIDLIAASVEAITLNGEALDPRTSFDGTRITLPGLAEANTLTVHATCAYMHTGEGLHRFVDPADGEVYLYTQFEVPDSRRVFPVFEQPDLKATFAFTVTAPSHWEVISNSPTPSPTPAGDGIATWAFPPTPRMSSYITALVAGPYDVHRDSVTTRNGELPLGVFCRKSLTQYLDVDDFLAVTKAGFGFFEEEFDQPYPFAKYDQIFTPEYNAGAMENAGAVTFNEVYIFRAKVPDALVERRALTVLHELAHMWFGDLVTMRWWDDLWLNESFAEWASTTCQAEATPWSDAWTTFGTYEKAWAYNADQLSSTHPIVAPIRDLADVEVNFDGITYAKGASVLKQLVAYVGREPFREGLRSYFAKHAWGNTTLADLLLELEAASGRALLPWSAKWLETAGVNTLRPIIETDDQGVITAAAIEQSAVADFPTLRPHRLAVGLYEVDGERLVRTDRIEIDVDGPSTPLPQLEGRARPALILVNDDDMAYAKIRLDDHSLATALAHPLGFDNSLPLALVLGATWDMTRDAEMPASQYIPLVLAVLAGISDSTLLRTLLAQLHTATRTYVREDAREATRVHVKDRLLELAQAAEPGSDAQLQLITAYAALVAADDDTAYLQALLDGSTELPGLAVDTEMRWTLLTALAAAGSAGAAEIDAEYERDKTATGRERAARAMAVRPTVEAKTDAWDKGVRDGTMSNSVVDAYGLGFGRASAPGILEGFVERYFAEIEDIWSDRTLAVAESIARFFYPSALASADLVDATQGWLDSHPNAAAGLRRIVAENRDVVTRALRAQALDATSES